MNTTTKSGECLRSASKSLVLCCASVLAVWAFIFSGPYSFFLPVVIVAFLAYFLRQGRFRSAALLVLVNPLSVAFLWGALDYANGTARLRCIGLPGTTFYNLDPNLRCGRSTSGCLVSGDEWVAQVPYNAAVRLFTAGFGWMPGSYKGPYPTESEAHAALVDATEVTVEDLGRNILLACGRNIILDEDVGPQLLKKIRFGWHSSRETMPMMSAALWQDECVVLRIPTSPASGADPCSSLIILISRTAGRPFAYYPEGEYWHRSPPVAWKRIKV